MTGIEWWLLGMIVLMGLWIALLGHRIDLLREDLDDLKTRSRVDWSSPGGVRRIRKGD